MSKYDTNSGYVDIDQGRLYYETAGSGVPLLLIHAGVTDSHQWDNEFSNFPPDFQVIRYDMRGYGKSEAAKGPFSHLEDLKALIDGLNIQPPIIMMGCSMGGILSLEYAIENPENIKALIMAGPGLCGLELDIKEPEAFSEAKKAFEEGDLELLVEIETQIWFDSMDHQPENVDCSMRALLYEMQQSVIGRERKKGKSAPAGKRSVHECLEEIDFPVLVIVGSYDLSYMHAAADYMTEHIPFAQKAIIEGAAHIPNIDQPGQFREIVQDYLLELDTGEFPTY